MRQVVKLLRLEQICLPDLKVSPTAVQEHSDVLQAQELEEEKQLRRFAWRRLKVGFQEKYKSLSRLQSYCETFLWMCTATTTIKLFLACASRGLRLNSIGSIVGSRKWMRLHNRTPSLKVKARILISEFVQFALMIKTGRNISLESSRNEKCLFCNIPVICWYDFATRKPSSALTPEVVG